MGKDAETAIGGALYTLEERLRRSNIKWVTLRPGLFMQNLFAQAASIKNESKIVQPLAADLPIVDVRDSAPSALAFSSILLHTPARPTTSRGR